MARLADDDRACSALAGIPGTVGFIGKFQLIDALVDGDYTWLAIVLVIGSMISLGYYLRVVATIWMRPPVAAPAPPRSGAPVRRAGPRSPAARSRPTSGSEGRARAGASFAYPEVVFVAVAFAAATIFFGIFPSPLFHLARTPRTRSGPVLAVASTRIGTASAFFAAPHAAFSGFTRSETHPC